MCSHDRNSCFLSWRVVMSWIFWSLFSTTLMMPGLTSVSLLCCVTSFHSPNKTLLCMCIYSPSDVLYALTAARVGLMHIGVFILLLLSGERNFGVRLNKPYSIHVPMDIPVFTGTHADLLIVVRCLPHYIILFWWQPNEKTVGQGSQLSLCLFCRSSTRLSPQAISVSSPYLTASSPLLLMVNCFGAICWTMHIF